MEKTASATSNTSTDPTLLGYLRMKAGDGLGMALVKSPKRLPANEFPFVTMNAGGPLARIFLADLTIGSGKPLMELFLLVQPDHYSSAGSDLKPLSNTDVEARWQDAISYYHDHQRTACPNVPTSQKDVHGKWVPFKPLFYCGHTDQFCHPLCPDCGAELTLCRDDQLLSSAQLPIFSQSLERFLYCSRCHQTSQSTVFYSHTVFIHSATGDRATNLRDGEALLQDFGRLQTHKELLGKFPCVGCDHAGECYGPDNQIVSRMMPVCFYPFYMLITPAPSLNLMEFVMLLSGASLNEIGDMAKGHQKIGRLERLQTFQSDLGQGEGFFFPQGDLRFIEVLYLKLTLLQALIDLGCDDPALLNTPIDRMSLEGFWIKLAQQSHRLPYFWGFDLQIIDLVGQLPASVLEKPLMAHRGRYFFGMAWFYVLLANSRQGPKQIYDAIAGFMEKESALDPDQPIPDELVDFLAPGNLFWEAASVQLDPQWDALWRRVIFLGMKLLQAGATADAGWSDEAFDEQLNDLRSTIRKTLFFSGGGSAVINAEPAHGDDQKIAAIVEEIMQRWTPKEDQQDDLSSQNLPEAEPSVAPIGPNEDGDVEETIILASEQASADVITQQTIVAARQPSMQDTPADTKPVENQNDPGKTVVIGVQQTQGRDELDQTLVMAAPPQAWDDELEKTVVSAPLTPPVNGHDSSPPTQAPEPLQDEVELEETIIMAPSGHGVSNTDLDKTVVVGAASQTPSAVKDHQPPDQANRSGDELEETVVITPADLVASKSGPAKVPPVIPKPPANGEDELEATIIINPKQIKKRKPTP